MSQRFICPILFAIYGNIKGWDKPGIILHAKDIAFSTNSSIMHVSHT